ncbi:flavin-containing monooxygenase [Actinoplanes sp. CA-054009]
MLLDQGAGTVIVGGGAAGLAAAWHLRRRGRPFVVLDAAARVGDAWRERYDCLRLFTPARFCALPGRPMALDPGAHPTRVEMADYLEGYARHFDLPVRSGVSVRSHAYAGSSHRLETGAGPIAAERVIVATGALHRPSVPEFAARLRLPQLHSSRYHRPGDLPPGPVLVVGAGTAGADIALDLAAGREVWLSGRPTGHIPVGVVRSALVRRLLYDRRVPPGGLVRALVGRRGGPLIWQSEKTLRRAGIRRVPRVAGVRDGLPLLADGRVPPVTAVVWCTGFRPGYGWLDARAVGPGGWPAHRRGVSATVPGLGFVGLPGQNTFGSGFLGGMSGDAAYVVERLTPPA